MNEDVTIAEATVSGVLEKFNGEPAPENLAERIYIENDEIVKVEKFDCGVLVSTEDVKGVD